MAFCTIRRPHFVQVGVYFAKEEKTWKKCKKTLDKWIWRWYNNKAVREKREAIGPWKLNNERRENKAKTQAEAWGKSVKKTRTIPKREYTSFSTNDDTQGKK